MHVYVFMYLLQTTACFHVFRTPMSIPHLVWLAIILEELQSSLFILLKA